MKRILLDHFRRWWWIIVPLLLVDFGVIFLMGGKARATQSLLFTIPIFFGPMLLSFDLRRNFPRTLLALPLTARQIGRSWWLATVGLPGLAILLMGVIFDATTAPGAGNSALLGTLVQVLWLGSSFFLLSGLPSGTSSLWQERVVGLFFSLCWGLLLGGGAFFFSWFSWDNPFHVGGFLTVGTLLSVAGWFRAETLALRRSGRAAGHPALAPGRRTFHAPSGSGGVPFLLRTLLRQIGSTAGMFVLMFVLLMCLNRGKFTLESWLASVQPSTGYYTFMFVLFATLPVIMHLRLLRSLPISASTLAALLVFFPAGLILGSQLLFISIRVALLGSGSVFALSSAAFLITGVCALCTPFLVWRGLGNGSYLAILVPIVLLPLTGMFAPRLEFYPGAIGAAAFTIIVGAWFLTRHLLRTGRDTYRVPSGLLGQWGGQRWS